MVDSGFEKECYEIYNSYRKEWLEDLLINKLLALRKMEFQDYMIGRWIKTSKVALRILFPSERQLYDGVFSEFNSESSDHYFSDVCHGAIIQLLNFADSFANRSPSPWRMFKILNLFETLCDLIHEFESLFLDSLVNEAVKIKNRLGEISKDIFMEFGNMIFLTPYVELDCWADGGVHPMTCEATSSIVAAFWSRQNLEKILQGYPLVVDGAGTSLFYSQMVLIMEQFERKLEAKSKYYEDPALEDWKPFGIIAFIQTRKFFELYFRSSWNKVIDSLKIDITELVAPNSKANSMKNKLSLFNHKFRETCGIQSTWRVFDEQLRRQIIISIEISLFPAYEKFISMVQCCWKKCQ
ncbi:exocyst subunit exo70 family protein [Medicago truncatula]|uniref:Exocyst subunit Exo70 family protein n=1 Tax=Medicago truncatula TaxID=3880 RepID=G7K5P7_MEDTR|nr:exocyst subunit exo70 family protein [Medicago truncatula]